MNQSKHEERIDLQQFFERALELARAHLPRTQPAGDTLRAARAALEEAHVQVAQQDFFRAVDALGGHEILIHRLVHAIGGGK